MLTIILTIAPVFVMILMGYALRRGGIPSTEFWNLNDKLVYWVLMPALFFSKISSADLHSGGLASYAGVLYAGFFAAVLSGYVLGKRWNAADASTVMQGSARFNTFIGVAIAESLFGGPGLQMAVLGSALLVPGVNITVVSLMSRMLDAGNRSVFGELVRNPLILSIGAGALFNLAGFGDVPVLHDCARILGQAALPVMLLCVGANLKLRGISGSFWAISAATLGKFVISPIAVLLAILVLHPDQLTAEVALIFAALPTGVAAYTLARQMGGNAQLMAAIITVQTLLSFATLPLTLTIARMILEP